MAEIDIRTRLWTNVRALMVRDYGKENINRLAEDAKVGPATVQRIKIGQTYVGLEVVEKIAKFFKVLPWQLIAPPQLVEGVPELSDEKFLEVLAMWRDTDGRGRRMLIGAYRGASHEEDAESERERVASRKGQR